MFKLKCYKSLVIYLLCFIANHPIFTYTLNQKCVTYLTNPRSNHFSYQRKSKYAHDNFSNQKKIRTIQTNYYHSFNQHLTGQQKLGATSESGFYAQQQLSSSELLKSQQSQKNNRYDVSKPQQLIPINSKISPAISKLYKLDDGKDRSGSFAIVQISGKQLWIEKGRYYDVNRVSQDIGSKIHLHRVLFYKSPDQRSWVGQPFLQKIRVIATVLDHFKGEKLKILKHKPKKRYRKLLGHRQLLTRIKIDQIEELMTQDLNMDSNESWLSHLSIYSTIKSINRLKQPSLNTNILKNNNIFFPKETKNITDGNVFSNFDPVLNEILIKNVLYN